MKQSFNPGMYAEISKRAFQLCKENNVTGKKEVKAMFDKAIKEAGYSPAYVAKVMRSLYTDQY